MQLHATAFLFFFNEYYIQYNVPILQDLIYSSKTYPVEFNVYVRNSGFEKDSIILFMQQMYNVFSSFASLIERWKNGTERKILNDDSVPKLPASAALDVSYAHDDADAVTVATGSIHSEHLRLTFIIFFCHCRNNARFHE